MAAMADRNTTRTAKSHHITDGVAPKSVSYKAKANTKLTNPASQIQKPTLTLTLTPTSTRSTQ
jgi:hypothetical protein